MRSIPVALTLLILAGATRDAEAGPLVPNPAAVNFGNVGNGMNPPAVPVSFTNGGGGQVTISNVLLNGPNPGDFNVDIGIFQPPFAIGPKVSFSVSVKCTPQSPGPKQANLVAQVAGGLGDAIVPLTCNAVPNAPIIEVVPPQVSFGTIPVLAKATQNVTIHNRGGAPLHLLDFAFKDLKGCNCFQLNNAPMQDMNGDWPTVPALKDLGFFVLCSPANVGVFSAEIDIDSDDVNNRHLVVPVTCAGAKAELKVDPTRIDFGVVPQGMTSDPVNVTISNAGGLPVSISSVTINGQSAGSFRFEDPGRFDLPPGSAKVVPVTCTPFGIGKLNAKLVVTPSGFAPAQVDLLCEHQAPAPNDLGVDLAAPSADLAKAVADEHAGCSVLPAAHPGSSGALAATTVLAMLLLATRRGRRARPAAARRG